MGKALPRHRSIGLKEAFCQRHAPFDISSALIDLASFSGLPDGRPGLVARVLRCNSDSPIGLCTMDAIPAINAALPAAAGSTTPPAKTARDFADVLADASPAQVADAKENACKNEVKKNPAVTEDTSKQEIETVLPIVIPLNLITVPSALVPVATPVPERQTPVLGKEVVDAPDPSLGVALTVPETAMPAESAMQTSESRLSVSPVAEGTLKEESEPAALPIEASAAQTSPPVLNGVEPPPSTVSHAAKKVEAPAESQADAPHSSFPAEVAAVADSPRESVAEVAFQIATLAPDEVSSPTIVSAGVSAVSDNKVQQNAGKSSGGTAPCTPRNADQVSVVPGEHQSMHPKAGDHPDQAVIKATAFPLCAEHSGPQAGNAEDGARNRTERSAEGQAHVARGGSGGREGPAEMPTVPTSQLGAVHTEVTAMEGKAAPVPLNHASLATSVQSVSDVNSREPIHANLRPSPDQPVPEAPVLGPVHVARLMERVGQSEMHVGLRTLAFGSVEVHTVLRGSQVGLSIGSEKGDLHSLLAPEVGALSANMRQHELKLESIHFFDPSSTFNANDFSGMRQDARSFHHPRFSMPVNELELSIADITESLAPALSGSGLSVHA